MKEYVLGFMTSGDRVALIRKNRPAWQYGKLNGIGGKIEPGESPEGAIRREFREETACDHRRWVQRLVLNGPDSRIFVFHTEGNLAALQTVTDERVEICSIHSLPCDILPNIRWMIHLVLDPDIEPGELKDRGSMADETDIRQEIGEPCNCLFCARHRHNEAVIARGDVQEMGKTIRLLEESLANAEDDLDRANAILQGIWPNADQVIAAIRTDRHQR